MGVFFLRMFEVLFMYVLVKFKVFFDLVLRNFWIFIWFEIIFYLDKFLFE